MVMGLGRCTASVDATLRLWPEGGLSPSVWGQGTA